VEPARLIGGIKGRGDGLEIAVVDVCPVEAKRLFLEGSRSSEESLQFF